jgi:hypothetical protein
MIKLMPVFAITVALLSQPAHAFGPAAMGRDLMFTSSIGRAPDNPKTVRAGFIRPNVPQALIVDGQMASADNSLRSNALSIGTTISSFMKGAFYITADAIDAGARLDLLR